MSDVVSLAENAGNILVWNNMHDQFPNPYTEGDALRFIREALSGPKPAMEMAIVIDGKAVGGIGISPQSDVERISAEMGYWLGEKYWNKGVMTEAVRAMLSYVFLHFPELSKVYAWVFSFNIASQRVLQKAGFEREGILRQSAVKNGKVIDKHCYGVLRNSMKLYHRFYVHEDLPLMNDLIREVAAGSVVDAGYMRDFGMRWDDVCILAVIEGKTAGGAWLRVPHGDRVCSNIDPKTPELGIAVFGRYRNRGIGTGLMTDMIDLAFHAICYNQISLRVNKTSPAMSLYGKFGFEIVGNDERDYVMLLKREGCLPL
jgi:RimJ/RimL family protein N-acetyltransferase